MEGKFISVELDDKLLKSDRLRLGLGSKALEIYQQ
jgi:hypothetical protein